MSESNNTYEYDPIEQDFSKIKSGRVLEIIAPVVAEINLYHKKEDTVVMPYDPILQENSETGHRIWSVILLYQQIKGEVVNGTEPKIYLYLSIDDDTGEISRTYPGSER